MLKISLIFLLLLSSINLAFAGVAVIVNPSNPINLSHAELAKLYLGKTKSFSNGDKCTPVSLSDNNPLSQTFRSSILNKSASQLKAYWSKRIFTGKGRPPKQLESVTSIKQFVANDTSAIAYIDETDVDASVRVVFVF